MKKGKKLYEGKAKIIFASSDKKYDCLSKNKELES